jgi:long-chain acyl-CoA synthetase
MAVWAGKVTVYDDLSVILGATLALVFSFAKWVSPVSLVHPILLGKQADVARVRKPGESAVYHNYGTGSMGMVSEGILPYNVTS